MSKKKTGKPVTDEDMDQDLEMEDQDDNTEEGMEDDTEELDENQEDLEDPDEDPADEEETEIDWKEAAKKLKSALENYSIEGYPARMKAIKLRPKYNDKEQRTPELYAEIMSL